MRPDAGGGARPSYPAAVVCGALGRFDADRIEAIARLTGSGLRRVHRERRCVLWLDREPIRWEGRDERGLAWSESPRPPGTARSWADAATALDACGLVIGGRRRFVHSSVSGLAPVYWMDDAGATYFCSRIDPLVQTATRRLAVDWQAWAAILRVGYAVGSRTPFEEVRRLEHVSTLERGPAGGVTTVGRWPWAEEELLPIAAAVDGLAEALRAELGALADRELVLGLSGGADSRLILAGLADRRATSLRTVTLPGNWGREDDELFAAQAAEAANVPNELLPLELDEYWRDADAFATSSDYQEAFEWAWFAPLVRRLAREPSALAVDGLAGEILVRGKYEAFAGPDPVSRTDVVWTSQHRSRNPRRLIRRRMAQAISAVAREQIDAVCDRLNGHPALISLAVYRARTTRGMAAGARALGGVLPTSTPYVTDAVARAALRCPPTEKLDGAFHRAAIARLSPRLAAIPVTSFGTTPSPPSVPQRRYDETALEGFRDLLRESPFRPWFRGQLRDAVESGPAAAIGQIRPSRLVNGYALHALWLRRYRDRLRRTSPRQMLG